MCSQTKSISWSPRKHSSPVGNVSHPVLRPDWAFPMHRLWRPVPCDSKSLQEGPLPTASVSSKNQMLLFTLAQCLTFPWSEIILGSQHFHLEWFSQGFAVNTHAVKWVSSVGACAALCPKASCPSLLRGLTFCNAVNLENPGGIAFEFVKANG